jgi:hypothetical protein
LGTWPRRTSVRPGRSRPHAQLRKGRSGRRRCLGTCLATGALKTSNVTPTPVRRAVSLQRLCHASFCVSRSSSCGLTAAGRHERFEQLSQLKARFKSRLHLKLWPGSTPEGRRPRIRRCRAGGSLAFFYSTPATQPPFCAAGYTRVSLGPWCLRHLVRQGRRLVRQRASMRAIQRPDSFLRIFSCYHQAKNLRQILTPPNLTSWQSAAKLTVCIEVRPQALRGSPGTRPCNATNL